MKTIGIVMIMLSSLIFGFELSRPVKKRIEILDALCCSLELMHAELSSRPTPIDALCCYLSQRSDKAARDFFDEISKSMDKLGSESFYEIWNNALNASLKSLGDDDKHAMDSLGGILGNYELSEQLTAIENCRSRLSNNLAELKSTYPANRKLYIGVSCSLGGMLALVFI